MAACQARTLGTGSNAHLLVCRRLPAGGSATTATTAGPDGLMCDCRRRRVAAASRRRHRPDHRGDHGVGGGGDAVGTTSGGGGGIGGGAPASDSWPLDRAVSVTAPRCRAPVAWCAHPTLLWTSQATGEAAPATAVEWQCRRGLGLPLGDAHGAASSMCRRRRNPCGHVTCLHSFRDAQLHKRRQRSQDQEVCHPLCRRARVSGVSRHTLGPR